jgi:hypothetical protein
MEENNPQLNTNGSNPKTLRTYSSDMADVVRENEISVIKIAVAEQKRHEQEDLYRKAQGTNISKFFLLIGAIALIGGGIAGAYFLLKKKDATIAPIEVKKDKVIESFISYEAESYIDTTNATNSLDITNILKGELEKAGSPGSIKALFLTTSVSGSPQLLSIQKLISLLKITAPGSLSRSFQDRYLVGTYTSSTGTGSPHLFLMFEANDYNVAYAGMLEWEKTMLDDLFGLFRVDVSGDRSELFERPFKDIIISNRDARILYDTSGTEVLYYIFLDKNKIIITDSQEAIKEIMTRLITKNTKPL